MMRKMIVTTSVPTIRRDAMADEAARAMHSGGIDELWVVDPVDTRVPVGRITASDIALSVVGCGLAPGDVPVANVMASLPVVAHEGECLNTIERRMAEAGLKRAPLVNQSGHLRGVVAIAGEWAAAAPPEPYPVAHDHRGPAGPAAQEENHPAGRKLSWREYQVMQCLVAGKRLKDAARDLYVSPNTLSTYRTRLLKKLGVTSNSDLVRLALHH